MRRDDRDIAVSGVSVIKEHRNLKKMFGNLVHNTRDGVVFKGLGVHGIIDIIVDLPEVGGSRDKSYFNAHADDLRCSKTVQAVFDRLRQHWDYLHPEIYGHLITELSLASLELVRDDYQTALDNFLNHTLLSEFCAIGEIAAEREGEPPQGFTECVTKHTWEPPPKFLRDVEDLRRQFAHGCNLQSCAVTVVRIRRGCTSITFLVPESTQLKIASDPEFIRDHCIIRVIFKGNVVYTEVSLESAACHRRGLGDV